MAFYGWIFHQLEFQSTFGVGCTMAHDGTWDFDYDDIQSSFRELYPIIEGRPISIYPILHRGARFVVISLSGSRDGPAPMSTCNSTVAQYLKTRNYYHDIVLAKGEPVLYE